jgi:hypothetical protein
VAASRPIQPHEEVLVALPDGHSVPAEIIDVTQRNWARTASGRGPAGERLFLKQFIGRDGTARRIVYDDERRGMELARRCFKEQVTIPRTIGHCDEQLITCYEHLDFVTVEADLRQNARSLTARWAPVCEHLGRLVDATADPTTVHRCGALPVKERRYASGRRAVNFKGFEIRNVAVLDRTRPDHERPGLAAFDMGRPYLGPVEEVAARLLVSALLLNWGFPVSRFVQGPPAQLADTLASNLSPWLHPTALRDELEREARARRTVTRFGSLWLQATKISGFATIGSWYLRHARRWCRDRGLA